MRQFRLTLLLSLLLLPYTINSNSNKSVSKKEMKRLELFTAIAKVESNMDPKSHNKSTDAVGIVQIRKILVKDVNRIYGTKFSYKDRWNKDKSYKMFRLYQNKYNPRWDIERGARIWNGGPDGMKKRTTISYYKKVKKCYRK